MLDDRRTCVVTVRVEWGERAMEETEEIMTRFVPIRQQDHDDEQYQCRPGHDGCEDHEGPRGRGTQGHMETVGLESCDARGMTMTRLMQRKRTRPCLQWLDYDVDIIDNMSRTKRFMSECASDDIVSKMSLSDVPSLDDKDGHGGGSEGMLSPSPLSRRETITQMTHDAYDEHNDLVECMGGVFKDEDYLTPRKPLGRTRKGMAQDHLGMPDSRLGSMRSPSDMKIDGTDLRRTALVRLALRNQGEHREGGSGLA